MCFCADLEKITMSSKKYEGKLPSYGGKNDANCTLERARGFAQPKWHTDEPI